MTVLLNTFKSCADHSHNFGLDLLIYQIGMFCTEKKTQAA